MDRESGVLPPGKALRITRIDYRVRLDAKDARHGGFLIEFSGKKLVCVGGEETSGMESSWFGELLVRRGEEKKFEVTCSMYALGEAVVHGALVDDPPK